MKTLFVTLIALLALAFCLQAQLVPALVERNPALLGEMSPQTPAMEFARLVVRDAIGVCKALDVRFSQDGARALQKYLLTGAVAELAASPEASDLPAADKAKNRHKFILLLVSEAESKPGGRIITGTSMQQTELRIAGLRDWFCPCFPFCK